MPAQDNQNGFRNGTCLTPREELPWRSDANANLHVRTCIEILISYTEQYEMKY